MYFAYSGMFDHKLIPKTSSGAMSPVEASSSTNDYDTPLQTLGERSAFGRGTMFRPRTTVMLRASSSGGGSRIWRSSMFGSDGAVVTDGES